MRINTVKSEVEAVAWDGMVIIRTVCGNLSKRLLILTPDAAESLAASLKATADQVRQNANDR
jgi:hypothetical protein